MPPSLTPRSLIGEGYPKEPCAKLYPHLLSFLLYLTSCSSSYCAVQLKWSGVEVLLCLGPGCLVRFRKFLISQSLDALVERINKGTSSSEVLSQSLGKWHKGLGEFLQPLCPSLLIVTGLVFVEKCSDGDAKSNVGLGQERESWIALVAVFCRHQIELTSG